MSFHPESVAIIGASGDANAISGGRWNPPADGYPGQIYAVNPNRETLPRGTGTAQVLCEYEVKAWLRADGLPDLMAAWSRDLTRRWRRPGFSAIR